ncbi:MAG: metal ABC transporter permease [Verrucomicrobiales bacterium]
MIEFFEALQAVPLLRYALLAGIFSSFAFGVVGSFVVTRRIGYIAAAIAHSILGGIGAAIFFSRTFDLQWLTPMVGAFIAALVSALVIGLVSLRAREREDTIIGAIWTIGMATGLIFMHYAPGPGANLESYIFGNILLTGESDVHATAILSLVVLAVTALFYHKLVAVCFDEEFARLRGVRSGAYFLLLLVLLAVSVVLLVRLTGIILAIALIVLPAATASKMAKRLWIIMIFAVALSLVYTVSGLAVSYVAEMPTGPVIVLIAAVGYTLMLISRRCLAKA